MKTIKTILPLATLIFLLNCASEPDLEQIDRLITEGKFEQAKTPIEQELKKEWSDTLQYKRLEYRLIKVEKGQTFKRIDSLTAQNPAQGLLSLISFEDSLQNMPRAKSRYFYFDLHVRKARIFKRLGRDTLWFKEAYKALNSFTDQYELKRDLFEQCAFYLAGQGKFDQGLKMLDNSFREIKLHKLQPELKKAYYAYLNGNFNQALTLLKNIEPEKKNRHWMNLQKYLENYAQNLSTEERFKLW